RRSGSGGPGRLEQSDRAGARQPPALERPRRDVPAAGPLRRGAREPREGALPRSPLRAREVQQGGGRGEARPPRRRDDEPQAIPRPRDSEPRGADPAGPPQARRAAPPLSDFFTTRGTDRARKRRT